jgi:hypothetical protein
MAQKKISKNGQKKVKGVAGRRRVKFDWEQVGRFLQAGCSGVEVAAHFGYDKETLYRNCVIDNKINFDEFMASKRQSGNALLKAKQYESAMQGDKTIMIWLGKQRLHQSEKNLLHIPNFSKMSDEQKVNALMELVENKRISADEFSTALNAIKTMAEIKNAKQGTENIQKITWEVLPSNIKANADNKADAAAA